MPTFNASGGYILSGSAGASVYNPSFANNISLTYIYDIQIRLDIKEATDSGDIQANAADPNGTFVAFNKPFKDIRSINVSVLQSTTNYTVTYNFVDVPNPTGFYVFVWNNLGVRQSALVSWIARGVI